ncbi:MAG: hypothetical protein ABF331_06135 [Hellea sp.]
MNAIKCRQVKVTRKNAIDLMCFDCFGANLQNAEYEAGTQEDIRNCTCKNCPLYIFRPFK